MIEIRVADWPRALAWYRDVLGLPVRLEDAPRRFALLDAGPGRVALKGDDTPAPARDAARLVFQVDDLDAERARLLALAVDVGPAIEHRDEGFREARLLDPDGTPITLFAWTR
jgi:catechol 2,3-dioxygenase-like lactoylglutathione lyase family enzyme